MQQSSCAPLRRRRADLLPLHHRHRWRTHHLRSPPIYVACITSLALEAPPLGCGGAPSASGGLGVGSEGRSGGSRRTVERSFPTCTALLRNPSHFTTHVVPLFLPSCSWTTPLCTGVAFHEVRSTLDHPSGLMSCDVHQHVTPWATYFCEAIAQRVGMGLRPGKLRKKALSEDNNDSLRTRGIAVQILIAAGLN